MGSLALIDPDSQKVETIEGFSERTRYAGGHGSGLTSADAGRGLIYVTDRTSKLLDVLDGQTKEIVASAQLASGPDYVPSFRITTRCGLPSQVLSASRYSPYPSE